MSSSSEILITLKNLLSGTGGAVSLPDAKTLAGLSEKFIALYRQYSPADGTDGQGLEEALIKEAGNDEDLLTLARQIGRFILLPICKTLIDTAETMIGLYLLLWLREATQNAAYIAKNVQYDQRDPAPDTWFQRVDEANGEKGTHVFNQDGIYLTNTIPPVDGTAYCNSEIYNAPDDSKTPSNVGFNLFPVDKPGLTKNFLTDLFLNNPYVPANGLVFEARIKVDTLKGGSRGWGFWNTCILAPGMQTAWFIQLDGTGDGKEKPIPKSGFYAITMNGLSTLLDLNSDQESQVCQKLPDLDEGWHDYRITLGPNLVEYFIDGKCVARVDQTDYIPTGPMAFHNWVDNAVFTFEGAEAKHLLQKTSAPRVNHTKYMRIYSAPQDGPRTCAWPYYTNRHILPQTQSPAQLGRWLSSDHPDYDLVSWCFYGSLIDDSGETTALCSMAQPLRTPLTTALPSLRIGSYEAGLLYNGSGSNGYRGYGTAGLYPSPALTITPEPWSVVASWGKSGQLQSTMSLSLTDGRMGQKDACYMLTADMHDENGERIEAEIRLRDRMGIVNAGYGPASFLPQWLTEDQQKAITGSYGGSVQEYLKESGDSMRSQGAYYNCAPLLEVQHFSLSDQKGNIRAQGNRGVLWMDYVVQSFNAATWHTIAKSQWTYFAIQLPELETALMISEVTPALPNQPLKTAQLFTMNGEASANQAHTPAYSWPLNQIAVTPDKKDIWTGPSKTKYALINDITLNGEHQAQLHLEPVRNNQEVDLAGDAKYEGLFTVSGTLDGHPCRGIAWGEVHAE